MDPEFILCVKHERAGRGQSGDGQPDTLCFLFHRSCTVSELRATSQSDFQWETRKLRWWWGQERAREKSVDLLCVVAFRWVQVGLAFSCCVTAPLLPYNSVQSALNRTANINTADTLVWNIWLHQIQQKKQEREREGMERDGDRYAFRSSYFTPRPAPLLLLLFLTQIVIPYLGEGRKGKRGHVTWEFGVVTEKNSSNFSLYHQKMRQD